MSQATLRARRHSARSGATDDGHRAATRCSPAPRASRRCCTWGRSTARTARRNAGPWPWPCRISAPSPGSGPHTPRRPTCIPTPTPCRSTGRRTRARPRLRPGGARHQPSCRRAVPVPAEADAEPAIGARRLRPGAVHLTARGHPLHRHRQRLRDDRRQLRPGRAAGQVARRRSPTPCRTLRRRSPRPSTAPPTSWCAPSPRPPGFGPSDEAAPSGVGASDVARRRTPPGCQRRSQAVEGGVGLGDDAAPTSSATVGSSSITPTT